MTENVREELTPTVMKYADYRLMGGDVHHWNTEKAKVSTLNLSLEKHQLGNKKMKKNEKLALISDCLT